MAENKRKLTEKELRRKEHFDNLSARMQSEGYVKKELTIGVLKANIGTLFVMLPFMAADAWAFFSVHTAGLMSFSITFSLLLLPVLLLLIMLHELIHGITWGLFAENHFRSIEFGVIWSALTPYCTCSEPMNRFQYMLGGAMPTIVLGAATAAAAVISGQLFWFFISELIILSGGGDYIILLKILMYRSAGKETVFVDHPYECGAAVFER